VSIVQQQILARHTVELDDGAEVEWSPRCGGEAELRLQIDPPAPPAGAGAVWLVNLYRRAPGAGLEFRNFAAADAKGRLSLHGGDPAESHDVVVLLPRGGTDHVVVAHLAGVRPRREPYRVEIPAEALPSARLRGRLVDGHGSPRANQTLVARTGVGDALVSIGSTVSNPDGTFDLGPLPPGRWTLQVGREAGAPGLGTHELSAGQVLDLGDLARR
jgi:hypothetical protein